MTEAHTMHAVKMPFLLQFDSFMSNRWQIFLRMVFALYYIAQIRKRIFCYSETPSEFSITRAIIGYELHIMLNFLTRFINTKPTGTSFLRANPFHDKYKLSSYNLF